jgi:hypothetical protein
VEQYLHSPNASPWRGAQLKHRDIFTFTFLQEESEAGLTQNNEASSSRETVCEGSLCTKYDIKHVFWLHR